jgi:hypothetical protein
MMSRASSTDNSERKARLPPAAKRGKAVEHWGLRDGMGLMRQLGVPSGRRPEPVAAG